MSARARIIARLRAAPAVVPAPVPDVTGWYLARQRSEDTAARVARLCTALLAAHAEVHEASAQDWPARLVEIATAKGVHTLLVGTAGSHVQALQARTAPGLHLLGYGEAGPAWRETLFDGVDAAFTRARSAVAETGSLVLWPDACEPRLMSLVPPIHFVLLDVADIHAELHGLMRAQGWSQGLPANVLLISGPSKTADIQQTLAYGAHGPRELVVLLSAGVGRAP